MGLRVAKKSSWSGLLHPPMANLPPFVHAPQVGMPPYSGAPVSQEDITKVAEAAPPEQVDYNQPDSSLASAVSAWKRMGGKMPEETSGRIGEENKLGYDSTRTTNTKNVVVTPTFASPELMAQQRAQAEQAVGYPEQLKTQQALNDYIAQVSLAKKPKVDLSPLMNLAGDWFGAQNLARGYKAPEGYKAADLIKYAQEQAKTRSELENQVVQNINAGKFPASQSVLEDKIVEAIKALSGQKNPAPKSSGGLTANNLAGLEDKFGKAIGDIGNKFSATTSNINFLQSQLNKGDVQSVRSILPNFAREVSGDKARLTNLHITSQLPDTLGMHIASAIAFIDNHPNEKLPTSITEPLKDTLNEYARLHYDLVKKEASALLQRTKAMPGHAAVNVDAISKPYLDQINSYAPPETEDQKFERLKKEWDNRNAAK